METWDECERGNMKRPTFGRVMGLALAIMM
jgi:hypothetical protein